MRVSDFAHIYGCNFQDSNEDPILSNIAYDSLHSKTLNNLLRKGFQAF